MKKWIMLSLIGFLIVALDLFDVWPLQIASMPSVPENGETYTKMDYLQIETPKTIPMMGLHMPVDSVTFSFGLSPEYDLERIGEIGETYVWRRTEVPFEIIEGTYTFKFTLYRDEPKTNLLEKTGTFSLNPIVNGNGDGNGNGNGDGNGNGFKPHLGLFSVLGYGMIAVGAFMLIRRRRLRL